jgi:hypothetical protein
MYNAYSTSPADRYEAITPSDTVDLKVRGRSLFVGVAGVVVAVKTDDTTCSFTVAAGAILPIVFKRINATSTTATGLVSLY